MKLRKVALGLIALPFALGAFAASSVKTSKSDKGAFLPSWRAMGRPEELEMRYVESP